MSMGVVITIVFVLFLVAAYIIHRIVRKTIWLIFCALVFLIGGVKVVHAVKTVSHGTQHALKSLTK